MSISKITGASIEDGSITLADLGITTIDSGTGNTLTLQANSRTGIVIDTSGNTAIANTLTFSSTGARIRGDMSNGTFANRVAFQTSTTNGNTTVSAIPNGTGNISQFHAFASSDPDNSSRFLLSCDGTAGIARLTSDRLGTGTFLPIAMYTNNTERLRIDTSGNVGIGTNSPSDKLNISAGNIGLTGSTSTINFRNGPGTIIQQIQYSDADGSLNIGGTGGGAYPIKISTSSTERMRIDSAGRIGIGTTSPSQLLHVAAGTILSSNTAGTIATVSIAGNGSTVGTSDFALQQGTSSEAYVYNRANSFLVLGTNNTERMRIFADGSVRVSGIMGINGGTPGNDYALNLNASAGVNGGLLAWNSGTTISTSLFTNSTGGNITVRESAALVLGTNNTERMRITAAGRVGIGITSPNFTLSTNASVNDFVLGLYDNTTYPYGFGIRPAQLMMYAASDGDITFGQMGTVASSTFTERMRITSGGNVGINNTSPQSLLDITQTNNTEGNKPLRVYANNRTQNIGLDFAGLFSTYYIRIQSGTSRHISFETNGNTERMRIDEFGNIGANVVPWTGLSNAFNYVTGVQRYIANGNMNAGTWTNTSLTLTTSNDGFVYAELVAIGHENGRNNGYKVYTILWNQYDGWQVSLKYSSQHGNNYGMVDVRMSGSTVQVKAENNVSGGAYRLFLTYYIQ